MLINFLFLRVDIAYPIGIYLYQIWMSNKLRREYLDKWMIKLWNCNFAFIIFFSKQSFELC